MTQVRLIYSHFMIKKVSRETTEKNTKKIGDLGEEIAAVFLMKQGFEVIERNYWRKWGELDLIVRKNSIIHFVEVKTVSYETKDKLIDIVSHETWRPEELVHQFKMHQISKAVETWLSDNLYEGDWVIDVAAVRIVPRETFASVNLIENVSFT